MSRNAFVAMTFEGNLWNDDRYRVIVEVLEEAGFAVARGDSLPSADLVTTEVAQQLRVADLVVIDSTRDSPNVSYEIGYCHGIPRDAGSIILLRKRGTGELPFNYRPYRHVMYRDLRELRRGLRYRLALSTPLTGEQLGFAMPFDVERGAGLYGDVLADSIVASLKERQFSGRCEYYEGNPIGIPDLYVVALGLKLVKSAGRFSVPTLDWWQSLLTLVSDQVTERTAMVALSESEAEVGIMLGIRENFVQSGVAEFDRGKVVALLNPAHGDSWFRAAIQQELDNSAITP